MGTLTSEDIRDLTCACKIEAGISVAGHDEAQFQGVPKALFGQADKTATLRLDAISNISGINALSPRKPLEFGAEALTVVFGNNGAGKSGYTRILKHACGARGARTLHGNVFKNPGTEKSCTIGFTLNGTAKETTWSVTGGPIADLGSVCLYDSDAAHVYVDSESEVTYEPSLLTCFRVLVTGCEAVEKALLAEIAAKPQTKASPPAEFLTTEAGKWYDGLTAATAAVAIQQNCAWTAEDDEEVRTLTTRLAEANPADRAKALRKTKAHVASLIADIKGRLESLGDAAFAALTAARKSATAKRKAASSDVERVFANAPIEGIGSENWRMMWEQARAYSETLAYPNVPFPNVAEDAVCVLCQQTLTGPAGERLTAFERFVKGNLEAEAATSEKQLESLLGSAAEIPLDSEIEASLDLCAVTDEKVRNDVKEQYRLLSERRTSFLTAAEKSELVPLLPNGICAVLGDYEVALEAKATAFMDDVKADTRPQLQLRLRELNARKWVSQQSKAVETEVQRLKEIQLLRDAIKLTNTKALSDKKSSLAEDLITKAFVQRFEEELAALGASRICATIVKSKTTKGQVLYQLRLKDCQTNALTSEILSEGEFRIVSLAAFLADVNVSGCTSSFVFDDPISSLDQDFEEATAHRLVTICESRQVIVFTHRLSLLATLDDTAEKCGVPLRVIAVQKESWGSGEPSGPPLPAQKPKTALNSLINERLLRARKAWENDGISVYSIEAKALCSDIRITLERLIELELLADVVQRFRRPITTMGKIEKLARIKIDDCTLMDRLMTKYSRYEHAQPKEAPVTLPTPDEIADDLNTLKSWFDEFTARPLAKLKP